MKGGGADFLSKLSLPENTTFAKRATQLNGKKLSDQTFDTQCGNGHYVCGVILERKTSGFHLVVRTIEDGMHKIMCELHVSDTGKLQNGTVNIFAFESGTQGLYGDYWTDADADYCDEIITEIANNPLKWDQIIAK